MTWPCVWTERTGEAERSLRRYSRDDVGCPQGGTYHNATVSIGRAPLQIDEQGYVEPLDVGEVLDRPDWPTACACGYVFTEDDDRQFNQEPIYRAADGREWPHESLPPGAMQDGFWLKPFAAGPDGIALVVVLPPEKPDSRGTWWHVDGPSRNNGVPGPGWTRTGDPHDPPTLSVTPSILTAEYRGFLTAGVLSDPL